MLGDMEHVVVNMLETLCMCSVFHICLNVGNIVRIL